MDSTLIMRLPTKKQISRNRRNDSLDFGNSVLYRMCRSNFTHNRNDVILAKVIIIGRVYAAAVERRKNKKETDADNEGFYTKTVVPAFRKSKLDKHLSELKKIKRLSEDNLQQVLVAHSYLTTLLSQITDLNKRSFSSKYLHFHLPHLFFIYDSRAMVGLRKFTSVIPKGLLYLTRQNKVDNEYAKFFCKCFELKRTIENQYKVKLTNRQLDNILIDEASGKKMRY